MWHFESGQENQDTSSIMKEMYECSSVYGFRKNRNHGKATCRVGMF